VANASISIVIAASTAPQAVEDCVRAVIAQTLRPVEIIVVGADSVLDTEALRRFGDTAAVPLRVFTQTRGASVADDLNAAWPVVRGEFLTFIEARETPAPDFLARLAAPLADAEWTCSGTAPTPGPVTLNAIVEAGPVIGAVLIARELADRFGAFDAATAGCERWETALQAALNAPGYCLAAAVPSAPPTTPPQPGAIA